MKDDPAPNKNLFLVGMILSMTCWGFSWSSGKVLSAYAAPITISFYRFAVTFLSLLVIIRVMRDSLRIDRSGWRDVLMSSALISLYTYFFFKGLTSGKAGAGGILVTVLSPIISYVIMLIMSRRKPSRQETLGLMLGAIAGVVLLRVLEDPSALWHAGNIYFLLASLTWAVLSTITERAGRYGSTVSFSCWMYGVSTVLMLLFTVLPDASALWSRADATFWANMFFSGTITTSLATTFFFVATSKIGAGKASSFIFLVPFSAALGSWIFLGEELEWHSVAGGILGLIAVYVLNKKPAAD